MNKLKTSILSIIIGITSLYTITFAEASNLTYGNYEEKNIPACYLPSQQCQNTIFSDYSEDPEIMTFIFLLNISKIVGTDDINNPVFKEKIQEYQEQKYQTHAYHYLKKLKKHFFWIEKVSPDDFKLRYKTHKEFLERLGVQFPKSLNDIAEFTEYGKPEEPLTNTFRYLAIGAYPGEFNTRNHDPLTTYMIDIDGGHVRDDLTLLSSRKYLDLNNKPYEFETIYVEVSASYNLWLYPEILEFFNRHLTMGGKLILELTEDPNDHLAFNNEKRPLNINNWTNNFGNILSVTDCFGRTLTRNVIELRGMKREVLDITYPKEFINIKELFNSAGFDHIKASELHKVQGCTEPYEMIKVEQK